MQHTIAVWNASHKAAEITQEQSFPLYGSENSYGLDEAIVAFSELLYSQGRKPLLSVGSLYRSPKFHRKDCWAEATAILLEWDDFQMEDLTNRIQEQGLSAVFFNTMSIDGKDPKTRVAVAFPLDRPISDAKDYSRLASLLASDIGLSMMTDGFHSCTFLVQPADGAAVVTLDGEPICVSDELQRTDFVAAKDYVGEAK